MAPRASWKGYLKLSLVSCPVRMYNATSSSERISFNLLHKDTHNRIAMKPVDPELGLVERSDLVKGYQYEKNQYVIIDEEDFDKVRIETTETINIEAFVDHDKVDAIYNDSPYYLAPDGPMAEETFAVLREAMSKMAKTAIAKVVLTNRERLVSISPRDEGMLLQTLRTRQEVRSSAAYFEDIKANSVDKEMLDLAEKLIEQKTRDFNPADFVDRYEEGLMAIITAKVKGETPVVAAAPERGKVINLMDALKKSLAEEKPPAKSKTQKAGTEKAAAPKATSRKPAAEKAAPRRKSA
jgi:DNA end-binding protein Ku